MTVHPHVCGERLNFADCALLFDGSSPRVWGTREDTILDLIGYRFIPTCVGNAVDIC